MFCTTFQFREVIEYLRARLFSVAEMKLLLIAGGWGCCGYWHGFSLEGGMTPDTWHIVMAATPG